MSHLLVPWSWNTEWLWLHSTANILPKMLEAQHCILLAKAPRLVSCRNDGRGEWAVLLLAPGWTCPGCAPEQRSWDESPCVGHVQGWGLTPDCWPLLTARSSFIWVLCQSWWHYNETRVFFFFERLKQILALRVSSKCLWSNLQLFHFTVDQP